MIFYFQIVFLFLEGKFGYSKVKLRKPSREMIERCESPIKNVIDGNTIITVEGEPEEASRNIC